MGYVTSSARLLISDVNRTCDKVSSENQANDVSMKSRSSDKASPNSAPHCIPCAGHLRVLYRISPAGWFYPSTSRTWAHCNLSPLLHSASMANNGLPFPQILCVMRISISSMCCLNDRRLVSSREWLVCPHTARSLAGGHGLITSIAYIYISCFGSVDYHRYIFRGRTIGLRILHRVRPMYLEGPGVLP